MRTESNKKQVVKEFVKFKFSWNDINVNIHMQFV